MPLCDRMVIAVGCNSAKEKSAAVEIAERVDRIRRVFASNPKVEVVSYEGLTVELCRKVEAKWMLRGIRSVADFEYESKLADLNRRISGIETLLLPALPEYGAISSSAVRELSRYGVDTSPFLP